MASPDTPMDRPDPDSLDELYLRLSESVEAAQREGRSVDPIALGETLGLSEAAVQDWIATAGLAAEAFADVASFREPDLSSPELPDDFELSEELGRGGMGIVYRVKQKSLDREVALKILRPGDLAFRDSIERFKREARSLARLKHPNIVPVHQVGQIDSHVYFTMDLVDGESLSRRLSRGPLTVALSLRIAEQIASAITHAHSRGVVHRDLKPANILLDRDEVAHVVDFGLARDASHDVTMTASGRLIGTPAYMSPEQARGESGAIGERSDVYALGTILYECVTGCPPFPQRKFGELLHAVMHDDPPRPRELVPSIPGDLERICRKAMAKEPEQRYPTMQALLRDLQAFQEGRPVLAREPSIAYRATRWLSRNRKMVATTAIVAALALAAATLVTAYFTRQPADLLLTRAETLEKEGLHNQARLLREMARDVTLLPRDDPHQPTAAQLERLRAERLRLERGVAFLARSPQKGSGLLEACLQSLTDWAGELDYRHDAILHDLNWLHLRATFALGRIDPAGRPPDSEFDVRPHRLHSTNENTRLWMIEALSTSNHPERSTAAWYWLQHYHPLGIYRFDALSLLREHPFVAGASLTTALRKGWPLETVQPIAIHQVMLDVPSSITSHGVLDDLLAIAGDSSMTEASRCAAAGWLAVFANVPSGYSDAAAIDHTDPAWIDLICRQYEAVRRRSWSSGLVARIDLAIEDWTGFSKGWLRNHVGPHSREQAWWRRWRDGLSGMTEKERLDRVMASNTEAAGLDVSAGAPSIEAALATLRDEVDQTREHALRMVITLLLDREGKLDTIPNGAPLEVDELPWERLDGDPSDLHRHIRVAEFDVSYDCPTPELLWEERGEVTPAEPFSFTHWYPTEIPFDYSIHAPGFVFRRPDPANSSVKLEARMQINRKDWSIEVRDIVRREPGSGSGLHGGVALLDRPIVIGRPYGERFPEKERLLLMTSSVDDLGPWSVAQWKSHLVEAIRQEAEIASKYVDAKRYFSGVRLQSFFGLIHAAWFISLPEARDSLATLSEKLPRSFYQEELSPARLLAGDPSPLVASPLARVFAESGPTQCIRLLKSVTDPTIREFAVNRLPDYSLFQQLDLDSLIDPSGDLDDFSRTVRHELPTVLDDVFKSGSTASSHTVYTLWVGFLIAMGSLCSLLSLSRRVSLERRCLFGAVAFAIGVVLSVIRFELHGSFVPTEVLGFLCLLAGARAATAESRFAGYATGCVGVSFALWVLASHTDVTIAFGQLSSFFLAISILLVSSVGVRRAPASRLRVATTAGYGILVFSLYGNMIWSYAAWGETAAALHTMERTTTLTGIWTFVLMWQLITSTLYRPTLPRSQPLSEVPQGTT